MEKVDNGWKVGPEDLARLIATGLAHVPETNIQVGEAIGVSDETVGLWSRSKNLKEKPFQLLFWLARRVPEVRDQIARWAGLETARPEFADPELRELIERVAVAWSDPRRRRAVRLGFEALGEAWGENGPPSVKERPPPATEPASAAAAPVARTPLLKTGGTENATTDSVA